MRLDRRIATACAISVLGATTVVPATAGAWTCPPPPPPKQKCNSGNGNGSDPITFVAGEHCYGGDPGNSYTAGNKGGDEIPTSGGVPNPGGNNVP
ncbi:MAG TPA: hypothetical protein VF032_08010 [Thermoleophilaceae bacterium]